MKEVTPEDKVFFFERAYYTLDGLWMIETEKETNWETALKIDTEVWIKLLKTIIRRIKQYLKIETNKIEDLLKILTFRWSIEGWDYDILGNNNIQIKKCPYKEIMARNPERQDRIPLICKDMCIGFYHTVCKDFNPDINFEIKKSQGLGSDTCLFQASLESGNTPKFKLSKPKVSLNDKLFYFERNFFTLDGLWIIEVENQTDWNTALKIDIVVWQRLYQIIFRRVKKYLEIETNNLKDLIEILSFCWSCEGYEYEITKNENKEAIIEIISCPYKAAMDRNPEQHNKIKSICIEMCVSFYEPALKEFNAKIKLDRKKFLGAGNEICDFIFKLNED